VSKPSHIVTKPHHLAARFFGSLSNAPADPVDIEWARSQLIPGEWELWRQMTNQDQRHSAKVARRFVAVRPESTRAEIAGALLHDVGKIGIPDEILRKPGALTDDEFAIVRQHVALGDAIVRDLPDIDLVRAGIRHHHERWDGDGYLDRLAGEDIPLIARILAVGDAFSAMTTTRPYRKALDLREALRRLEDAAGSQLDEALVTAFVAGIETADDAPLPGVAGAPRTPRVWTPRVA
jgi:HD-GYP domain-containing protein (c-di-GMP phosphodiesterase class II)